MAADVAELAVGGAWEDLAAVAAKELYGVSGFRFHDSLLSELGGNRRRLEDSRKRELKTLEEKRKGGKILCSSGAGGLRPWGLKTLGRDFGAYL